MVVKHGLSLAGVGVVLGLLGSVGTGRLLESFLFGISNTDAITYLGTALVLAVVVSLARYIPSRRAAAMDPAEILRED